MSCNDIVNLDIEEALKVNKVFNQKMYETANILSI